MQPLPHFMSQWQGSKVQVWLYTHIHLVIG